MSPCVWFWRSLGIGKGIRIHPLGTVNVCTNFLCNPSHRCRDISVWSEMANWPTDTAIPWAAPLARLKTRGVITAVHPRVPAERPAIVKADMEAQTGSLAISKTFTQQLLRLNGSRSFIPKTQSKRGIDQKEIKSEQRGFEQRARSDRQHQDRAVRLCRLRAEWLGNFWSL